MTVGSPSFSAGYKGLESPDARTPTPEAHVAAPNRHKQLVHAAQQLVSQTFYGQLLKQMRQSPFKSELFDGGRGGQMFSAMLDQTLADRMAKGEGNKLVRSIVRHIEKGAARQAAAAQPPASQGAKPGAARKPNPFQNVRIHVAADLRA